MEYGGWDEGGVSGHYWLDIGFDVGFEIGVDKTDFADFAGFGIDDDGFDMVGSGIDNYP